VDNQINRSENMDDVTEISYEQWLDLVTANSEYLSNILIQGAPKGVVAPYGYADSSYRHHVEKTREYFMALYLGAGLAHFSLEPETVEKLTQLYQELAANEKQSFRLRMITAVAYRLLFPEKFHFEVFHEKEVVSRTVSYLKFLQTEGLYIDQPPRIIRPYGDSMLSIMCSYYASLGHYPHNPYAMRLITPIEDFPSFQQAVKEKMVKLSSDNLTYIEPKHGWVWVWTKEN
jgi:hypothetical protein